MESHKVVAIRLVYVQSIPFVLYRLDSTICRVCSKSSFVWALDV
jgi:hypothetical protein